MIENLERENNYDESKSNKVLAELVAQLVILNSENHSYGNLFCRMLRIIHSKPIDSILSTFLTKINKNFYKLIDNFERRSKILQKKKSSSPSKGKNKWTAE